MRFKLRVCIITGGAKGIGQQIAKTLKNSGAWKIICTSRENLHTDDSNNNPEILQLNVLDEQSIQKFVDTLQKKNLKVDLLIHNAGVGYFGPIDSIKESQINETFNTNTIAPILLTKKLMPILNPLGARIISIGSIVETRVATGNSVYASSKAALRAFADQMNEENKDKLLSFTHLSLGAVKTEIWNDRSDFNSSDMIPIEELSPLFEFLSNLPATIRIDHIDYFPKKGLL